MSNPVTKIQGAQAEQAIVFPSDIVPGNPKELEVWMHQWADAIINYGQFCFTNRDAANQNAALGIINAADYEHITNFFVSPTATVNQSLHAQAKGNGGGYRRALPAKLRPINVLAAMVNKMVGRIEGEGFDFSAYVINEDAVSQKLEEFSAEYAKKLTRFVRQQSDLSAVLGTHLYDEDQAETVVPKEVEDAKFSTFQQENEIQITNGLAYLLTKKDIFLKHKLIEQGARSLFTTGKMAFDTFIENDPNAQFIPPQNIIYELNSNSPFIQHGRYSGYWFSATPQELLDRCPELTPDQMVSIESQFQTLQNNGNVNRASNWYRWDAGMRTFYFTPYKVYWCGNKKLKVKITPNKFDEENPHIHFVDEKEKINPDKGEKFEYRYLKTWYETLKIGESIYYQAREIPGQHQSQDEPELSYGPLIGIVDPNPCPVDLVRPLQELRTECWFTAERLLGQAKGNILIVDEAGGQDVWGQNYNMLAFGVYVHDSSLEGPDGQKSNSVPVTKDMGLSQAVSDIFRTIAFIDQNIAMVSGDNDASKGVIKSDQGLGITQNALQQAQFTLQPYYANYYTTVEMVLQGLCDMMRPAWSGRKKTAYFMGDAGKIFFELDPGTYWHMADYGLSLRNSVGSTQAKKFMIETGANLLSTSGDPETALSVMKMIRAKSDAECERIFEKAVEAIKVVKQKTQEIEQQQAQAALKQKGAEAQQNYEVEMTKAKSPVNVKTIDVAGKEKLLDKKNQHAADAQTVEYQNEILRMAAQIIAENQKKGKEEPETVS